MPSAMKPKITASATISHAELVVKLTSYLPRCSGTRGSTVNWCIGSILVPAATLASRYTQLPGGVRVLESRMMFLTPTPNPKNSISRKNVGKVRWPNAPARLSRPHPITAPPTGAPIR